MALIKVELLVVINFNNAKFVDGAQLLNTSNLVNTELTSYNIYCNKAHKFQRFGGFCLGGTVGGY